MSKQAGFTYPFTLMMLLLFLIFFSLRIDNLVIERKTAKETSVIRQQEYYLMTSIKKIEKLYQSGTPLPQKNTFTFTNGSIVYQSEPPVNNIQIVNLTLCLTSGETFIGRGYFNLSTKQLYKWLELGQ